MEHIFRHAVRGNGYVFSCNQMVSSDWGFYTHPKTADEININKRFEGLEGLDEPGKSLMTAISQIPGVTNIECDYFEIQILGKEGCDWSRIIPAVQELLTGYDDPSAETRRPPTHFKASAEKKRKVAGFIENGLKSYVIKEDHEVFVSSRSGTEQICGCALMIAVAGMGIGGSPTELLEIERAEEGGASVVELCAGRLRIPMDLANKIDHLHRVEMVPAMEIAHRLRTDQI